MDVSSPCSLRGFVESNPDAILIADPGTGEIVDANVAAESLFGYSQESFRGMPVTDLHPTGEEARYREIFEEHIESGPAVISTQDDGSPVYIETADDQHIPVEINAWTTETDEGQFIHGVIRDISQRRERAQQLRRIQRAVEASGHAIYITDSEGLIEYANPAFESVTGYSVDEAIGKTPEILRSGEMSEGYYGELWETVQAGDVWAETVVNRRKDGTLYHAHQTIAPVTDTTGAIEAYVAIQTDISEQKQLEADLQESIQQLQVLDRVLRHNLRNDMNVVRGNAETIRDDYSGQVADLADTIVEQSTSLLETVDKERKITDQLAASGQLEPVDMVPLFTAVANGLRDQFPTATIELDLPAEATVSATRNLERAIRELVQNAIVHSDRDRPRVIISASVDADRIALHITDDGPGIPEMERKIVASETEIQPLYHGSGLGLWLVHLIVKKSRGSLTFTENDPRGTVATIELDPAGSLDAE